MSLHNGHSRIQTPHGSYIIHGMHLQAFLSIMAKSCHATIVRLKFGCEVLNALSQALISKLVANKKI